MEPNKSIKLYHIGSLEKPILFFADDKDYYKDSQITYKPEEIKEYNINFTNAKIWKPIDDLNLSVDNWSTIWGKVEDFKKYNIAFEYSDDVAEEDLLDNFLVYTSTDDLATAGKKLGYDATILNNIASPFTDTKYNEYIIYNKNIIKDTELNEQLLLEKKRQEILAKSRKGDQYKSRPGENRYTRRTKSKVAATVADYNKIDMDALWKGDILEFGIKVQGETNNYIVTILFEHLLDEFKRQIRQNHNKLEFRCILQALLRVFNSDDIYISCSCPDFIYGGYNYYSFRGNFNSNPKLGKALDKPVIRNPNDTKGDGCKHILLCLANLDWLMKIASVIHNYINYCKEHMEYNYTKYIAPKLFDETQMMLFDPDNPEATDQERTLDTDQTTIDKANIQGKTRGQFKAGSNKNPVTNTGGRPFNKKDQEDKNQLKLNFGQNKELKPENSSEN